MRSLFALFALCCASLVAQAEPQDNPMYAQWKAFKPGSWVKVKQTNDIAGQKSEAVETQTLKSIDENEAVVIIERTMVLADGQQMTVGPHELTIPAKIDEEKPVDTPAASGDPAKVEESTETVDLAGAKLDCKKTTITGKDATMATWSCEKVPGHVVRYTMKSVQGTMERVLDSYEAK